MMKTIIKTIAFGLILITQACSSLIEEPKGFISPSNFYKTEADALAAVIACYRPLPELQYYPLMHLMVDMSTDNSNPGRANAFSWQIDEFTNDAGNDQTNFVWNKIYEAINAANAVTEYVPAVPMDETKRSEIIAEAKFLRALNYFNLVRLWGDVPLSVHPTTSLRDLNQPRTPADEVYGQIISDLLEGVAVLPVGYSADHHGRATKYAAQALLAKVYLTLEAWESASEHAKAVIEALPHGLFPHIDDLWLVANQDAPEFIFSLQSMPDLGVPNLMSVRSWPRIAVPGQGIGWVEEDFLNSFEAGDGRRDAGIWTSYTRPNGAVVPYQEWADPFPHMAKWRDAGNFSTNSNNGEANTAIIRFADVLLIYAEAQNELHGAPGLEAYEAINKVRRRAFKEDIHAADAQPHDLSGLSKEGFRDAVLQERAWELCFEWNRWFDLVRTNRLVDVMKPTKPFVSEKNYLYPVPQPQILINPNLLPNNPGF